MSHSTTKVSQASSRANPAASDPSETNLDLKGSTSLAAVDTSVPSQHDEYESRAEKQNQDKRKLQNEGQGFEWDLNRDRKKGGAVGYQLHLRGSRSRRKYLACLYKVIYD
ncbi:hypothetical protein NEOLEDRAFT_1169429 [Neolentinus lepideus HHB14362 ss-1]|uniref:Uncharacterized protein n=1 Tax=Neolentinus lepideus HHB14362 ss-1 TaxID=1314782 RepID=A0A165SR57_9AGAM|nr:hypothetical protein NEOLEDRAFT_1169429 [Neolentinus lepideus HHB14362 ss-1]